MDNKNGNQARCWELFQDGLSRKQIAEKLNLNYGTVKTNIRRAKNKHDKGTQAPTENQAAVKAQLSLLTP